MLEYFRNAHDQVKHKTMLLVQYTVMYRQGRQMKRYPINTLGAYKSATNASKASTDATNRRQPVLL